MSSPSLGLVPATAPQRRFCFPNSPQRARIALRPVEPHEGGRRVVLKNLSEEIRECYQHAEDCARKAAAQSCPKTKQDFLELEQRWLFLARSYEFTERLSDFSEETKRNADKLL
jgi:hypothetical protein